MLSFIIHMTNAAVDYSGTWSVPHHVHPGVLSPKWHFGKPIYFCFLSLKLNGVLNSRLPLHPLIQRNYYLLVWFYSYIQVLSMLLRLSSLTSITPTLEFYHISSQWLLADLQQRATGPEKEKYMKCIYTSYVQKDCDYR